MDANVGSMDRIHIERGYAWVPVDKVVERVLNISRYDHGNLDIILYSIIVATTHLEVVVYNIQSWITKQCR